jgi:hypothetical protein
MQARSSFRFPCWGTSLTSGPPLFDTLRTSKSNFLSVKAISYQYDAGRSMNIERAARIHQYGAPEVLAVEPVKVTAPGPGEVRIRHTATVSTSSRSISAAERFQCQRSRRSWGTRRPVLSRPLNAMCAVLRSEIESHTPMGRNLWHLNRRLLHLIRGLISPRTTIATIVEFCGPAVGVPGNALSGFKGTVIFQKISAAGARNE